MTLLSNNNPLAIFPELQGSEIEQDVTRFLTDIGALEIHYAWHLERFGNIFDPVHLEAMTIDDAEAMYAASQAFRDGVRGEIEILPYHVRLCAGDGRVPSSLFDLVIHQDVEGVAISTTTVQLLFLTERLVSVEHCEPRPVSMPLPTGSFDEYGVFVLEA